ncbi:activity-dependent neuroprotective protein 2a [Osmerus mordax]|uniref:activity-dependent neuroprotective protein 2a n=1 Tax=Osmerus mordax TaxID=8014 RepID=UPI00350F22B2
MYQLPVEKLDKIRKSRKRVKSILSDIGLDSCKDLLEELKCFDAGDDCFENTEWDDFTDSYNGKRRKKWGYRTETLCCALCWFSTRSWYTFRGHVQRCHEEEVDLTTLTTCPSCPFVSHPDLISQHVKLFHGNVAKTSQASAPASASQTLVVFSTANVGDKYSCRNCGFHDSLIYVMRKHVLVNHYRQLLTRYFGQRSAAEQTAGLGGTKLSQFHCRECSMPAETSEHLLYHILSSDKHREVHAQIRPLIMEHVNSRTGKNGSQQSLPNLAPRSVQRVVSLVSRASQPVTAKGPSSGTVLLAPPSTPTALVCSPGARQVLLPPQTSAKGLILTSSAVAALQNNQTNTTMSPMKNTSISMLLNNPKQQPITVGVSQQQQPITVGMAQQQRPITVKVAQQQPITVGVSQQQTRQVLLPPGVQISVQNKLGVGMGVGVGGNQSLMLTQRLPIPQPAPRSQMLSTQSVRLVPTGNKVNGIPTYTLETVQMAVPVQTAGVGQVVNKAPILVTTQPQPSQSLSVPVLGNGLVRNQSPGSTLPAAVSSSSDRPKELVVRTQFLRRMRNTVKCTRCQILLSDKGIFQHLLHGLRCLFCPLIFYSIRQIMEHCTQEHSLAHSANRDRLKKEFKLTTDEQGHLVIPSFDMSTSVPQDLLGFKHLNLVLVTASREKIYLQMSEEAGKLPCPTLPKDGCPFCPEKPQSSTEYEQHLRIKHHIVPTIHAILKSPAFKCVYCLGVYADKSTAKTISIHVQRCRCAPKAAKDAERLINPDPNSQTVNGLVPLTAALDQRKDLGQGKVKTRGQVQGKESQTVTFDPSVPMVLDPTGMEMRSFEDRKLFLGRYFNKKPYLSRQEQEALAGRLWFNRTDVASLFGGKRSKCMKAIQRHKAAIFLGFNMTEVSKVKHNLIFPAVETVRQPQSGELPADKMPTEGL